MKEAAVVLDMDGKALYWHAPSGRSSAYIPDSQTLWDVMWENRAKIYGLAHVHPGGGVQAPSLEDITTFSAVEEALGKKLDWWIATYDSLSLYNKKIGGKDYVCRGYYQASWSRDYRVNPGTRWYKQLMELANEDVTAEQFNLNKEIEHD